jgi:DNA sulfur modification protein DndD
MILDRIQIRNYGVYRGTHEAVLTPFVGKPIILFGGLNGGGKTTLLDAFQLALYGARARLSNRGRLGYKDYLAASINRDARPGEWAEIQLDFTKVLTGKLTRFSVTRSWRDGSKGVTEELSVAVNGNPDSVFTEHWDEIVDTYLPSSISHLFFFDGEQIAALAEQSSAAAILGAAVNSLLGLDLVDRLADDLKALERRKQASALDGAAAARLKLLTTEKTANDALEESLVQQRAELSNDLGRLKKDLASRQADFKSRGGLVLERLQELESQERTLRTEKQVYEDQLRQLAAGALPLALVAQQLEAAVEQAGKEAKAARDVLLLDTLAERDESLLASLRQDTHTKATVDRVSAILAKDRADRHLGLQVESILGADTELADHLKTLQTVALPECVSQSQTLLAKISGTEERLLRLEAELSRAPEQDAVADVIAQIAAIKAETDAKTADLDGVSVRYQAARRRSEELDDSIQKISESGLDARHGEDSRLRILKHSKKARQTLNEFRLGVVRRHITTIETLVLEAFRSLLRKKQLIHSLSIDPVSFEVMLWQQQGVALPFDRLSAGERQLLATALLWGLARAAGRPIPTIIDTPLGRLDSQHRGRLVEGYFPHASHQVILLSTDEEIAGHYYRSLKSSISREYILSHDDSNGATSITPGYFTNHEATV